MRNSPVFSLHLPSLFLFSLVQLATRMLLLAWRLLGEPLWSCSPRPGCCHLLQGMRSLLGLPQHQHFQWKSLPRGDLDVLLTFKVNPLAEQGRQFPGGEGGCPQLGGMREMLGDVTGSFLPSSWPLCPGQ